MQKNGRRIKHKQLIAKAIRIDKKRLTSLEYVNYNKLVSLFI